MRDIALFITVFSLLPFILRRPYIGVLTWSWLGYMNPQRLTWGPSHDFPFSYLVALTLLVSLVFNPERHKFPMNKMVVVWLMFLGWTLVTCTFAIYPDIAWHYEIVVLKIQLILFISLWMMGSPERIKLMVWVIFFSIAFFGIKGGIFIISTGGAGRVYGPPGSFIAGNNELAVAMLMVIPLGFYLRKYEVNKPLYKRLFLVAIFLTATAVIGSFSRGALLAITAVSLYLWWKTPNKLVSGVVGAMALMLVVLMMPSSWSQRMDTIKHYKKDNSAEQRINSWHYSINIADARLTGGGYWSFSKETFERWAPDPRWVFVAHSIYFSVLADHGWIGLILFLTLFTMGWFKAGRTSRMVRARAPPEEQWIAGLSDMIKVSLVAYAVGGAFLSLAYFDLPWHLLALIVLLEKLAQNKGYIPDGRKRWSPPGRSGPPEPAWRRP